ncbi:angiopoietin-2 [Bactrocera oleae]|uniref:angiopoietin-2 n=1 Tax=Bactrocera oleae TaxID=104688 RepID=UPI00387E9B5C
MDVDPVLSDAVSTGGGSSSDGGSVFSLEHLSEEAGVDDKDDVYGQNNGEEPFAIYVDVGNEVQNVISLVNKHETKLNDFDKKLLRIQNMQEKFEERFLQLEQNVKTAENVNQNLHRKFNCTATSPHRVLPPVISDCAKAKYYLGEEYRDGIYELHLPGFQSVNATCVTKCSPSNSTRCCTWTVVVRNHESAKGTFQRSYNDFKVGFGNASTDYFIGLDRLYELTRRAKQSLLIVDFTIHKEIFLHEFHIKDEKSNYEIYGIQGHVKYLWAAMDYYIDQSFEFSVDDECALKNNRGWWYPTRLCKFYAITPNLSNDFFIALEPQICSGEGVWDDYFQN